MSAARERRKKTGTAAALADIQVDLIQLAFQKIYLSTLVSTIGVGGITSLLALVYRDSFLWGVVAVIAAIAVVRIATIAFYYRHRPAGITARAAVRTETVYGTLTVGHCLTMAAITLRCYACHDRTAMELCIMGVLALTTGLLSRIAMRPWISLTAGLAMLASLATSIYLFGNTMDRAGIVLLGFFSYAFVESVRNRFDILVEQLRSRRFLRELAEQDALTGLANRRQFEKHLAEACDGTVPFSVLYIDLDRFKPVNDTYGHAAGDMLLQQVASRIRGTVRTHDLVSRLGGDEFAVLLIPTASAGLVEQVAARINQVMAVPFAIKGQEIRIGASIGVRMALDGATNALELLNSADFALYRVKQAGGGSFALASE